MKRFYKEVAVEPVEGGFRVTLDGRGIKTAMGAQQVVPSRALADAMAAEWAGQGEEIDPARFFFRDLANYTLCYRADPDEPLHPHQRALWEPVLTALEAQHGIKFQRVSGIMPRAQPPETLAVLEAVLEAQAPFTLAALNTMASLAASLAVALAALDEGADAETLWAIANAEEDWQAEQWGWEWTAEEKRAQKLAEFGKALEFLRLVRAG
jgi:chaperone required for assembly of F1-ATPase